MSHSRLSHTVRFCEVESVRVYVNEFVKSFKFLVLLDKLNSINLIISNNEKFVIEIPNDFSRTIFYALPSTHPRSDLDIQTLTAEALRGVLGDLERRVNEGVKPDPELGRDWELSITTKASAPGSEPIDVPRGFDVAGGVQSPESIRFPCKTAEVNNSVVLSLYTDIPSVEGN